MSKCPICGGEAYIGAFSCECSTVGCQNYKPIDPNISKYQITCIPITLAINSQVKEITIRYKDSINYIGVIIEPPDFAKQFNNNTPGWKELVEAAEKDAVSHIIVDLKNQDLTVKDGKYTVALVRKYVEIRHGLF